MDRRRTTRSNDVRIDGAVGVENEPAAPDTPAVELRKPRHGGWKGKEPGRLDRMLRGEPGYHLGRYRPRVTGGRSVVSCRIVARHCWFGAR